jgi:hypothetical protein
VRDVTDSAAELEPADLTALAGQLDGLITLLRNSGAKVVAAAAGPIL